MSFALQEAVVVLAHLLSAFRFELLPGHVVELVQRVTLRPRYGMRMIAQVDAAAGPVECGVYIAEVGCGLTGSGGLLIPRQPTALPL